MINQDDEEEKGTFGASRYPCMPSLVALQQMRNRLHLAYLGKKLMKWTTMATGRELRKLSLEMSEFYTDFEEEVRDAYLYVARCRYFFPSLNHIVLENVAFQASLSTATTAKTVSGVRVSQYEVRDNNMDSYPLLGLEKGGQILKETKRIWKDLLKRMMVMLELRSSFQLVEAANKGATKKFNVLAKLIIPKIVASLEYIMSELEEAEREDNFRLKRFKELKVKKAAEVVQVCSCCLTSFEAGEGASEDMCNICNRLSRKGMDPRKKVKIVPCDWELRERRCHNLEKIEETIEPGNSEPEPVPEPEPEPLPEPEPISEFESEPEKPEPMPVLPEEPPSEPLYGRTIWVPCCTDVACITWRSKETPIQSPVTPVSQTAIPLPCCTDLDCVSRRPKRKPPHSCCVDSACTCTSAQQTKTPPATPIKTQSFETLAKVQDLGPPAKPILYSVSQTLQRPKHEPPHPCCTDSVCTCKSLTLPKEPNLGPPTKPIPYSAIQTPCCADPNCIASKPLQETPSKTTMKSTQPYCKDLDCMFNAPQEATSKTSVKSTRPYYKDPDCLSKPSQEATQKTSVKSTRPYCKDPDCILYKPPQDVPSKTSVQSTRSYCKDPDCLSKPPQEATQKTSVKSTRPYCKDPDCILYKPPQDAPSKTSVQSTRSYCKDPDCLSKPPQEATPKTSVKSTRPYCKDPDCILYKPPQDAPSKTSVQSTRPYCKDPDCITKPPQEATPKTSVKSTRPYCKDPDCISSKPMQEPPSKTSVNSIGLYCKDPDCPSNRRSQEPHSKTSVKSTRPCCKDPDCPSNGQEPPPKPQSAAIPQFPEWLPCCSDPDCILYLPPQKVSAKSRSESPPQFTTPCCNDPDCALNKQEQSARPPSVSHSKLKLPCTDTTCHPDFESELMPYPPCSSDTKIGEWVIYKKIEYVIRKHNADGTISEQKTVTESFAKPTASVVPSGQMPPLKAKVSCKNLERNNNEIHSGGEEKAINIGDRDATCRYYPRQTKSEHAVHSSNMADPKFRSCLSAIFSDRSACESIAESNICSSMKLPGEFKVSPCKSTKSAASFKSTPLRKAFVEKSTSYENRFLSESLTSLTDYNFTSCGKLSTKLEYCSCEDVSKITVYTDAIWKDACTSPPSCIDFTEQKKSPRKHNTSINISYDSCGSFHTASSTSNSASRGTTKKCNDDKNSNNKESNKSGKKKIAEKIEQSRKVDYNICKTCLLKLSGLASSKKDKNTIMSYPKPSKKCHYCDIIANKSMESVSYKGNRIGSICSNVCYVGSAASNCLRTCRSNSNRTPNHTYVELCPSTSSTKIQKTPAKSLSDHDIDYGCTGTPNDNSYKPVHKASKTERSYCGICGPINPSGAEGYGVITQQKVIPGSKSADDCINVCKQCLVKLSRVVPSIDHQKSDTINTHQESSMTKGKNFSAGSSCNKIICQGKSTHSNKSVSNGSDSLSNICIKLTTSKTPVNIHKRKGNTPRFCVDSISNYEINFGAEVPSKNQVSKKTCGASSAANIKNKCSKCICGGSTTGTTCSCSFIKGGVDPATSTENKCSKHNCGGNTAKSNCSCCRIKNGVVLAKSIAFPFTSNENKCSKQVCGGSTARSSCSSNVITKEPPRTREASTSTKRSAKYDVRALSDLPKKKSALQEQLKREESDKSEENVLCCRQSDSALKKKQKRRSRPTRSFYDL